MARELLVVSCQSEECLQEVVLPFYRSMVPYPGRANLQEVFLDVACPRCAHVFRYPPNKIRRRIYFLESEKRLPEDAVPLGVWLMCDRKDCPSHALVESAMAAGTKGEDVRVFAARWQMHGITCYYGHPARVPLALTWDSITAAEHTWGI